MALPTRSTSACMQPSTKADQECLPPPVTALVVRPEPPCDAGQQQLELIAQAEQLLQDSTQPDHWQQLNDEELLSEIERFRACIRGVHEQHGAVAARSQPAASQQEQQQQLGMPRNASFTSAADSEAAAAAATAAADGAASTAAAQGLAAVGTGDGGCEYGSVDDLDPREWQVPPQCIPIHANVTTYNWSQLYSHIQFDVIMMDPPWQLATANPTRGVSLGYSQLTDADIASLPIPQLQSDGFLFIWVINAKYKWTLDLFEKWGYTVVDEVVWVKMTVNRRMAKSHGYYLQHAKEVCLVGKRGSDPPGTAVGGVGSDIIFSERRGQSQKPEEVYELIEELVPNGRYLEIFARKNNLRNYWVSVGNEVTGTGLPVEDMDALRQNGQLPNAVFGRGITRPL